MRYTRGQWSRAAGLFALAAVAFGCERSATDVRRDRDGAALSAAVAMDTGGGGGGRPVFNYQGSGEGAEVSFVSNAGGGFTYGEIMIFLTKDAAVTVVDLSYFVARCDVASQCSYEGGAGSIPVRDFQGTTRTGFHLSTNTSAESNPVFYRWGGDGGPIVIDWLPNDAWFTHEQGTYQTQLGELRIRRSGTRTAGSALVNGSFFGLPITPTTGYVDSYREAYIRIEIANADQP